MRFCMFLDLKEVICIVLIPFGGEFCSLSTITWNDLPPKDGSMFRTVIQRSVFDDQRSKVTDKHIYPPTLNHYSLSCHFLFSFHVLCHSLSGAFSPTP